MSVYVVLLQYLNFYVKTILFKFMTLFCTIKCIFCCFHLYTYRFYYFFIVLFVDRRLINMYFLSWNFNSIVFCMLTLCLYFIKIIQIIGMFFKSYFNPTNLCKKIHHVISSMFSYNLRFIKFIH